MTAEIKKILELIKEYDIEIMVEEDNLKLFNRYGVYPDFILDKVKNKKNELISFLNLVEKIHLVNVQENEYSSKRGGTIIHEALRLQSRRFLKYKLGVYSASNLIVLSQKLESVNLRALEKSIDTITNRHQSLRTLFLIKNRKVMLRIYPKNSFKTRLVYDDISLDNNKNEKLEHICNQVLNYLFDFENEQSFLCTLIKYGNKQYELIFIIDHIISDVYSLKILREELSLLYNLYSQNRTNTLKPLKLQLSDFAEQFSIQYKGQNLKYHKTFYKNHNLDKVIGLVVNPEYSGYDDRITEIQQQTINHSPKSLDKYGISFEDYLVLIKKPKGAGYTFSIPKNVVKNLRMISSHLRVSIYCLFLSVFSIFIAELGNQKRVIIDSPISMRNNEYLSKIVGWLTGAIRCRIEVDKEIFLSEHIKNCKNTIIEAMKHSNYSSDVHLDKFVQAQLNFIYNNGHEYTGDYEPVNFETDIYFDLSFMCTVFKNDILISCTYNKNVIRKSKITSLCNKFIEILEKVGASKNSDIKISNIIRSIS